MFRKLNSEYQEGWEQVNWEPEKSYCQTRMYRKNHLKKIGMWWITCTSVDTHFQLFIVISGAFLPWYVHFNHGFSIKTMRQLTKRYQSKRFWLSTDSLCQTVNVIHLKFVGVSFFISRLKSALIGNSWDNVNISTSVGDPSLPFQKKLQYCWKRWMICGLMKMYFVVTKMPLQMMSY